MPKKSKPIIFSTEMVRAILDGRKTQTRRVIKPRPGMVYTDRKERYPHAFWDGRKWIKYKYQPGDILWVRETWVSYATIDSWLDDKTLCKVGIDGWSIDKMKEINYNMQCEKWISRKELNMLLEEKKRKTLEKDLLMEAVAFGENQDACVSCGEPLPEGIQVCPVGEKNKRRSMECMYI